MPAPTNYYPEPTGNQKADEALRIAFDNLYSLRDAANAQQAAAPPLTLAQIQAGLQSGGANPLNLTNLSGSPALGVTTINALSGKITIVHGNGVLISVTGSTIVVALQNQGPGAGTYVTGLKLTGGGHNGSITIDATGRITAITQAT